MNKDLQGQIDELIDMVTPSAQVGEPPVVQAGAVEPVQPEPPAQPPEPSKNDEPVSVEQIVEPQEASPEPPPAATPVEPAPVPPPSGKVQKTEAEIRLEAELARNQELMNMIAEKNKALATAGQPQTPPADGSQPSAEEPVLKFVEKDDDIDAILRTPESFNKFCTGLVQKTIETIAQGLPNVVIPMAREQVTLMSTVNDFYRENNDLLPYREYVGYVVDQIVLKDPSKPIPQVLQESEVEVRSKLRLPKSAPQPVVQTPPTDNGGPAFVQGGGARPRGGSGSNLSRVEKDVLDLVMD